MAHAVSQARSRIFVYVCLFCSLRKFRCFCFAIPTSYNSTLSQTGTDCSCFQCVGQRGSEGRRVPGRWPDEPGTRPNQVRRVGSVRGACWVFAPVMLWGLSPWDMARNMAQSATKIDAPNCNSVSDWQRILHTVCGEVRSCGNCTRRNGDTCVRCYCVRMCSEWRSICGWCSSLEITVDAFHVDSIKKVEHIVVLLKGNIGEIWVFQRDCT